MKAKVLVPFYGVKENLYFEAGREFEGTKTRVEELAKKGWLDYKPKSEKGEKDGSTEVDAKSKTKAGRSS